MNTGVGFCLRVVFGCSLLAVAAANSHAGVINQTFLIDSGGSLINANERDFTQSLNDGGVSFDATLKALGSSTLSQQPQGMGVLGNGGAFVDTNAEWLLFSMTLSNMVGGSVTFDRFTAIDLAGLAAGSVVFGTDATFGSQFRTESQPGGLIDISGDNVTAFAVRSTLGSFFVDSLNAQFTTTPLAAVPEPGSVLFLSIAGVAGVCRLRRRSNARDA